MAARMAIGLTELLLAQDVNALDWQDGARLMAASHTCPAPPGQHSIIDRRGILLDLEYHRLE